MTNVGDGLSADKGNWKFNGSVVDSFDDHVSAQQQPRSEEYVPL